MSIKKYVLLAFLVISGVAKVWAGADYYCDCDVKLNSPSSAQGVVYINIDSFRKNSKNPTVQTGPSQNAQLRANLKNAGSGYGCYFMAYPKTGYVLDGFVAKRDYQAGRTSHIYYLKNSSGKIYKSGSNVIIEKKDTLRDSKSDPTTASTYRFSPKSSSEYYAIFRKANSQTVFVNSKGTLQTTVRRGSYGEEVDNLIIRGPIDETDIQYLKQLIQDHNLVRLDLSSATITEIPDNAFSSCYSLYEVKLPSTGLVRVGTKAFSDCYSLKSCPIPSNVKLKGEAIFFNCHSMQLNIN